MQKELGQTWLIDPRPGANGIVAGQMLLGAPADGYTLYLDRIGPCRAALPDEDAVRRDGRLQADRHGRREHRACSACRRPRRPTTSPSSWPTRRPIPASSTISIRATARARTCCPSCSRSSTTSTSRRSPTRACRPACRTCWAAGSIWRWSAPRWSMQHVKAGRLKAIALVGPKRLAELPDVATMAEQGAGDDRDPLHAAALRPEGAARHDRGQAKRGGADGPGRCRDPDAAGRRLYRAAADEPGQVAAALAAEHERLGKLIQQLGIKADGTG